ncbi:hypothetical protein BJ742DRAFT_838062 [Cladochytrium replicatum]|nr:hypothetical protein BJ742DRAFT_838062 [Cladochytrium replicatum]
MSSAQQHHSTGGAGRRKTVVERLANAFTKATARVSRQVRAGLNSPGPIAVTIPPNLATVSKNARKTAHKASTSHPPSAKGTPNGTPLISIAPALANSTVAQLDPASNVANWSSEPLPVFRAAAACQGAGFFMPTKEDRIVFIDDLYEHVHVGFPRYDVSRFGDTMPLPPPDDFIVPPEYPQSSDEVPLSPDFQIVKNFKLFCVFDGHCGQYASTYLQYRFPFELCGSPAFHAGDYERALQDTYNTVHRELLRSQKYGPEAPNNDFSAGATASAILVTPTRTYFAALGDSPILVWRRNGDDGPDLLFKEHDAENPNIHGQLIDSNIFLVLVRELGMQNVYYLVTSRAIKERVLAQAAAASGSSTAIVNQLQQHQPALREESQRQESPVNSSGPASGTETPQEEEVSIEEEQHPENISANDSAIAPALDDDAEMAKGPGDFVAKEDELAATPQTSPKLEAKELDSPNSVEEQAAPASPQQVIEEDIPFSDLRIGFSALNVFGTLGDSMYDIEVFNTLIDELIAFREERVNRYNRTLFRLQEEERVGIPPRDAVQLYASTSPTTNQTVLPMVMGQDLEDMVTAYYATGPVLGGGAAPGEGLFGSQSAEATGALGPLGGKPAPAPASTPSTPTNSATTAVPRGRKDREVRKKRSRKSKSVGKGGAAAADSSDEEIDGEVHEEESTTGLAQLAPLVPPEEKEKPVDPKLTDGSLNAAVAMLKYTPILFPFEVFTSLNELQTVDPIEFSYPEFRWWAMARPRWEFLRKHLSLLKKEQQMSRVLLAAMRNLNANHRLTLPGLIRKPEVTSIANRELVLFVVASDGVIRFYEKFRDEFRGMIMRHLDEVERSTEVLKEYMKWLRDDRSVIVARFGFGTGPLYSTAPPPPPPAAYSSALHLFGNGSGSLSAQPSSASIATTTSNTSSVGSISATPAIAVPTVDGGVPHGVPEHLADDDAASQQTDDANQTPTGSEKGVRMFTKMMKMKGR